MNCGRHMMRELRVDGTQFGELVAALLSAHGRVRFRARGASMVPAVADGDVLTVARVTPDTLCAGDLVLYLRDDGRPVAHRLADGLPGGDDRRLRVRADAGVGHDELVPPERVLGRIVSIEREGSSAPAAAEPRTDGAAGTGPGLWRRIGRSAAGLHAAARRLQAVPGYRRLARGLLAGRVSVREATPGDADALQRLHLSMGRQGRKDPRHVLARCTDTAQPHRSRMVVALAGGRVVGTLMLAVQPHENGPQWQIEGLFVRKRLRGAGIGEALVCCAIDLARRLGGRQLRAGLPRNARAATKLLEKLGFQEDPLSPEDAAIWVLELAAMQSTSETASGL